MLFYRQVLPKVCFLRSGEWLIPAHFDGTWTLKRIISDIARRTGRPAEIIERSLPRLTDYLVDNRVINNEIH